jgi:short-subunit dehydrogenase
MRPRLVKLEDQVIVITGATSGIGLATARAAARRGARVVLTSRNEEDLARIQADLEMGGAEALAVGADVADPHGMEEVRDAALSRFGRIDTWVNNAGVAMFGKLRDTDLVEARRLFDVNFWGVVNGCRAAIPAMADSGGAIVNVGSMVCDRVIPLQGFYVASKHAVKGYTDALRMELEMERLPISVSLVKPSATATPYAEHAKNLMSVEPRQPPPVYAPELVADVILYCAEHPRRDVVVGASGMVLGVLDAVAPRMTDKVMERTMDGLQRTRRPRRDADADSLFMAPLVEGRTRGHHPGHVMKRSLYTALSLHRPAVRLAAAGGLALALALLLRGR